MERATALVFGLVQRASRTRRLPRHFCFIVSRGQAAFSACSVHTVSGRTSPPARHHARRQASRGDVPSLSFRERRPTWPRVGQDPRQSVPAASGATGRLPRPWAEEQLLVRGCGLNTVPGEASSKCSRLLREKPAQSPSWRAWDFDLRSVLLQSSRCLF